MSSKAHVHGPARAAQHASVEHSDDRSRANLINSVLFFIQGIELWHHLESLASARWLQESSILSERGRVPFCLVLTQDCAKDLELVLLAPSSCAQEVSA